MVGLIGCAVSYKRRKPIVSIDIMTNKSNVVYFVAKSIIRSGPRKKGRNGPVWDSRNDFITGLF